tara:strand:- start:1 stop:339 length:339 start_codon:yes stop_codon:yes gene_type:complete
MPSAIVIVLSVTFSPRMNRNGIVPAINLRPLSSSYLCLDRPVRAWFDITQDKYDEERRFLHCFLFTRSFHFFQNFFLLVKTHLFSNAFDDVEEKKKPQECGSTTNNSQAGKE